MVDSQDLQIGVWDLISGDYDQPRCIHRPSYQIINYYNVSANNFLKNTSIEPVSRGTIELKNNGKEIINHNGEQENVYGLPFYSTLANSPSDFLVTSDLKTYRIGLEKEHDFHSRHQYFKLHNTIFYLRVYLSNDGGISNALYRKINMDDQHIQHKI